MMDPSASNQDDGEQQRAAINRELEDKLGRHREYLQGFNEPQSSNHASSETATTSLENRDGVTSQPSHTALDPPESALQSVPDQFDPQVSAATTTQPVTLDGQMAEEQQLEPDVRRIPRPPRRRLRRSIASADGLTNVYV